MYTNVEGVKDELSETRHGTSQALNGRNGKNTRGIRNRFSELATFMADPNLFTALEKVGNDKVARRQAKTNPVSYLKGEGLVLPRGSDVKIMYSRERPKPKPEPPTVSVDLEICLGETCAKVKGTITIKQ